MHSVWWAPTTYRLQNSFRFFLSQFSDATNSLLFPASAGVSLTLSPFLRFLRSHNWSDSGSVLRVGFIGEPILLAMQLLFFSCRIFSILFTPKFWAKLHLLRQPEKKASAQRMTDICSRARIYCRHAGIGCTSLRAVNSTISIWLANVLRLKLFSSHALDAVAVTSERICREWMKNWTKKKKKNGANKNSLGLGTCVFHDDDDGTRNSYVFVVYFCKTSKSNCVGIPEQSAPLAANAKVHVMIAFWRFAFFPSFNSGFGSRCCCCWLLL